MYRPRAVSIISWFLVINGALTLLSPFYMLATPQAGAIWDSLGVPLWQVVLGNAIMGIVSVVSGVGMLEGRAWGRRLYLVATPLLLLLSLFVYGFGYWEGMLLGVAFYLAALALLTRPLANAYFAGTLVEPPPHLRLLAGYRRSRQQANDVARVFGVLFAGLSGFLLYVALMAASLAATTPSLGGFGAVLISVAFVTTPALVFLALAIRLWGPARWMAVAGWVLVGTGVACAVVGVMALSWSAADYGPFTAAGVDPEDVADILGSMQTAMRVGAVAGSVLGLAGFGLLWHRYRADHAAVARLAAAPDGPDRS